ncbi:RNA polymerase Rpc34 [Ascobolus immersus RN42]|uniref:DNA-directed RNA polymerase III subunit RPC6 n=1 Tax=Ascobolus immersus RN42 TaxID=1160509 RepID=A0A3N4IJ88_ASCIM|nr:RNA polymerase Rpc34 [Ascobolus immersus RN42]
MVNPNEAIIIDEISDVVYEKASENPEKLYKQHELAMFDMRLRNPQMLVNVINYMMQSKLLSPKQQGNDYLFQINDRELAERLASLTTDEALVYQHVQESGREGIWTKTLKLQTKLHQTSITKAIKSLESKCFIKPIKSVKHPARKIYMLYHLQPSYEVSGGPWFTSSDMDQAFIHTLLDTVEQYIAAKSNPKKSDKFYPPNYTEYATVDAIHKFIKQNGITEVELQLSDIKSLVDILVYDQRVEPVGTGGRSFRSVRKAREVQIEDSHERIVNGFTESPCGRCPVFHLCSSEEDAPVNAKNCVYWQEWIDATVPKDDDE